MMKPRQRAMYLLIVLLLSVAMACSRSRETINLDGIPVQVFSPDSGTLSLDDVEAKVRQLLPRAYYSGLVFEGGCESLSVAHGIMVVQYNQIKRGFLRKRTKRVIVATATVYTALGYMDLDIVDYSGIGVTVDGPKYPGSDRLLEAFSQAQKHITEMGLCGGNITITQLQDGWAVSCGPRVGRTNCYFEIPLVQNSSASQ